MDIGIKMELSVPLTSRNDQVIYCQNLPIPIHLTKRLIFDMAQKPTYHSNAFFQIRQSHI